MLSRFSEATKAGAYPATEVCILSGMTDPHNTRSGANMFFFYFYQLTPKLQVIIWLTSDAPPPFHGKILNKNIPLTEDKNELFREKQLGLKFLGKKNRAGFWNNPEAGPKQY
jgi:hypothetical protein